MFQRTIWTAGEVPESGDWNVQATQWDYSVREMVAAWAGTPLIDSNSPTLPACYGFMGTGFKVVPVTGMEITFQASPDNVSGRTGIGLVPTLVQDFSASIDGCVGADDLMVVKPLVLQQGSIPTITVPAASAYNRIDLVEARFARVVGDQSVPIWNGSEFAEVDSAKSLTWALTLSSIGSGAEINYVQGGPSGIPPSVDPDYVAVAYVNVPASTTVLTASNIVDARTVLMPAGGGRATLLTELQTSAGVTTILGTIVASQPSVAMGLRVVAENQVECCVCAGQTGELIGCVRAVLGWVGEPACWQQAFVGQVEQVLVNSTIQSNYASMNLAIGQQVWIVPIEIFTGLITLSGVTGTTAFNDTYFLTITALMRNQFS